MVKVFSNIKQNIYKYFFIRINFHVENKTVQRWLAEDFRYKFSSEHAGTVKLLFFREFFHRPNYYCLFFFIIIIFFCVRLLDLTYACTYNYYIILNCSLPYIYFELVNSSYGLSESNQGIFSCWPVCVSPIVDRKLQGGMSQFDNSKTATIRPLAFFI